MIYIPGNCCNCGDQAVVKNFNGTISGPVIGAKIINLVTSSGSKKSSIPGLILCPKCNPATINPIDIYNNLTHPESTSGLTSWPEYDLFGNLSIEVIKTVEIK